MSLAANARHERIQLAASLLAVQAALTVASAIEAALIAVGTPNSAGMAPAMASAGWGGLILLSRRRLVHGQGRRLLTWLEISLLVWSSVNLALAAFLVGTSMAPVVLVTGFLLPVSILVLVRGQT